MTPSIKPERKQASPLNGSAAPQHAILEIEVIGGFLDGVKLEFAPGLNCIIGGRGSGKTTVVEFLRYALTTARGPSAQSRQLDRLIEGNLSTGRLRIRVQTREGLVYTVDRAANEEPQVFNEEGEPVDFPLDGIFEMEVYSQNEIEEIAGNPHFQLELIDKFIRKEIGENQLRLKAVYRDLGHNASEILKLKGEILELSEGQAEIKLLQERLKKFQTVRGQGEQIVQDEVAKKSMRDRERRHMTMLTNFLDGLRRDLEATKHPFESKSAALLQQIRSDLANTPNAALFKDMAADFSSSSKDVAAGFNAAIAAVVEFQKRAASVAAQLDKAHKLQEQKYLEVVAKYEKEKGFAQEQSQLQKKLTELMERRKELEERTRTLRAKLEDRRTLLMKMSELRDKRWQAREAVAKNLNTPLHPHIRISIQPCGDRRAYKELLKESLKKKGGWYTNLVEKIAANIPPADLASLIQSASVQELVNRLDIDEEKASWLVSQLKDTEEGYRLEIVEVEDKPSVELLDGEYKDSTSLSIGQKCTTILPILLLGSSNPLLVDQPEDNLDNNFIYETVVSRIQAVKQERQMIFVTHNPNIPVLGGASRVFVLESNGSTARLRSNGPVDDKRVRADIETFLEGGRAAFVKRKEIYGID